MLRDEGDRGIFTEHVHVDEHRCQVYVYQFSDNLLFRIILELLQTVHYVFRMYVESDNSRTKKLYITSIQSGDEGSFTCTAHGPRIQLRKSVQLLLFSKYP